MVEGFIHFELTSFISVIHCLNHPLFQGNDDWNGAFVLQRSKRPFKFRLLDSIRDENRDTFIEKLFAHSFSKDVTAREDGRAIMAGWQTFGLLPLLMAFLLMVLQDGPGGNFLCPASITPTLFGALLDVLILALLLWAHAS